MERAAAEVMERISRKHEVVILARECKVRGENLTFEPIQTFSRPNLLGVWAFRSKVRRREKQLDCTLTNSIGASAINADVITAQFCHAAFHAAHGGMRGGSSPLRRHWQNLVERIYTQQEHAAYTSSRLKKVIAVSEGIKRELITHYSVPAEKIVVIPNAVDHDVFKPAGSLAIKHALRRDLGLPEDDFLCLFVGGDWDRKGLADAIRAIAGLPKTRLVVVGSGDAKRFGALARAENAEDQILFPGRSLRSQDYYTASDVFVFPSRYEAFSLVTIEAAASGLPVIALRINGTEELIEDGVNGFFVEPTPESIREKVEWLQQNPDKMQLMSKAALKTSQRYTWDRIAQEQSAVFEAVANSL